MHRHDESPPWRFLSQFAIALSAIYFLVWFLLGVLR